MSTGPKQAIFAEFAGVARALGHAHRLELLEHLAQGERGVEALAERVGLSIANASQHLQQLRRAGLVANRREGKFILYRLADDGVVGLTAALRAVAERNLAEVGRKEAQPPASARPRYTLTQLVAEHLADPPGPDPQWCASAPVGREEI